MSLATAKHIGSSAKPPATALGTGHTLSCSMVSIRARGSFSMGLCLVPTALCWNDSPGLFGPSQITKSSTTTRYPRPIIHVAGDRFSTKGISDPHSCIAVADIASQSFPSWNYDWERVHRGLLSVWTYTPSFHGYKIQRRM